MEGRKGGRKEGRKEGAYGYDMVGFSIIIVPSTEHQYQYQNIKYKIVQLCNCAAVQLTVQL